MKHKKKAWNNTNPLYRYLHSGKKAKTKHKKRGAVRMAKKRGHRSAGSGFGGGKLMKGLFTPKGMIASAIIGLGTATIVRQLLGGEKVPYQGEALGFVTGGVAGAGAVFLMKNLSSMAGGKIGASSGNY